MRRVVDEVPGGKRHPIRPEHINAESHFYDSFGNAETEVSARWIVRLCQGSGDWRGFTRDEIEKIYNKRGLVNFSFNRLVDGPNGFVMLCGDGRYRVTHEFICRCLAASPREGFPFSVVTLNDSVSV